MAIEFRKFIPEETHSTFRDSLLLMEYNFTDPSATSAKFLQWLYLDNPYRQAIGYIAYDGDTPASQLFITFQSAVLNGKEFIVGLASNACTMPEYRKQGLFHKIFQRLVEDCRALGVPFIWAYPNPASLRGFLKTGFDIRQGLSLEVMPTNYFGLVRELKNKEKFQIMAATEDVPIAIENTTEFELVVNPRKASVPSTNSANEIWHTPMDLRQVEWRYWQHPTRTYHILRHKKSDEWIVLRFIRLFGMKAAVLMKTSCQNKKQFRGILADLKIYLRPKINFTTTLQSDFLSNPLVDMFQGCFRIPYFLSPRRFPLAIYTIDKNLVNAASRFSFALGDYEAL
jgi:hypothetical protein